MGKFSANDIVLGVYNRNRRLKDLSVDLGVNYDVLSAMSRGLRPIPEPFARKIERVFALWDLADTTPRTGAAR